MELKRIEYDFSVCKVKDVIGIDFSEKRKLCHGIGGSGKIRL